MKLLKPNKKYEISWYETVEEFKRDRKSIGAWKVLGDPEDLAACIVNARKYSQGKCLPAGWVPYDLLWLIDGDEIIGLVSIRHSLNDFLSRAGGHIGYEIRPSKRGNGYGNQLPGLALKKAKKLISGRVLVVSSDDNVFSCKIIERNGGKLENKIIVANRLVRRYWI